MFIFHTDNLFPDWIPFEPVRRILSEVGLTPDEVSLFEAPFNEFRHQEPDSPLRLPEDIRTSEEWFRLLFTMIGDDSTTIYQSENPDSVPSEQVVNEPTMRRVHTNIKGFTEYGFPQKGYIGQINLDNIGRDFLCLIYYRQRVLDLWREGGLESVLSGLFSKPQPQPLEYNNLNNSLIPVEAVVDTLSLWGTRFGEGQDLTMTILSDPPQRHLTLREVPVPVRMFRDTANLSRYIRNLSSCLQDGGQWEDLNRLTRQDFELREEFSFLRDRRVLYKTDIFSRYIAMSREFYLWDIERGRKYPSIRRISEEKQIPYVELLRTMMFGYTNDKRPINRFEGLEVIRGGFTSRLNNIFKNNILMNSPKGNKRQ